MRIAMASTGNSLEAKIDTSFGRCAWFVIYDTSNGGIEFIPNPTKGVEDHAGQSAVEFIKERNVSKIISGDFGLKIKPMLDSLNIQMIVVNDNTLTIHHIIQLLKKEES
ncbi:MAG: NifB/NifX family molybdenum-iron cluster-binding protein [Lentimicrobiaceae bacterium]|nr:NifB/NifX family molybdenum-iron cluster-binding protein [Lentimicrobiaceae bacterium]